MFRYGGVYRLGSYRGLCGEKHVSDTCYDVTERCVYEVGEIHEEVDAVS
jgi:hypothetical protein